MIGSKLMVYRDNRSEETIRRSLLWQWFIAITFVSWFLWFVTDHYNGKSFWIPILITISGIPAGWLFGYKMGFGPVFSSVYIFSAERVIEKKK